LVTFLVVDWFTYSNKILINESKDDNDNVNSTSETFTVCPLCKTDNAIITDPKSGEIICSKCGMVASDKLLERRPEWSTFAIDKTESRARTGLPSSIARHDMGLSTIIGKENTDASRNKIEPSVLSTMHRLRTWDFRTQVHSSTDRTLRIAFSELAYFSLRVPLLVGAADLMMFVSRTMDLGYFRRLDNQTFFFVYICSMPPLYFKYF